MVRAGQEQGFQPWQRVALTLLFVWPLAGLNMEGRTYVMAPPMVAVGVFVMAWLFARREMIGRVVTMHQRASPAPSGVV